MLYIWGEETPMNFTYSAYNDLVRLLQRTGYTIKNYDDYAESARCVILRHDVDNSLEKAYELAEAERQIGGVKSTYFIMLTSGFYNVFSSRGMKMLEGILSCGHEIGLHFDEVRYPEAMGNAEAIREKILLEADLLSKAAGKPVTKVSMHRPSKNILESNLTIPGMVNTYSEKFFKEFKYLSDSRRRWREPVEEIIREQRYERLQILLHPFWYQEKETDIKESVSHFVNSANLDRYDELNDNLSNLSEILNRDEVHI